MPRNLLITMEEQQNNHPLIQSVLNYIEMTNTGAFMITGAWGCGKTYFFNHEITNELHDKGITTVKVSLFGVENAHSVLKKVKSELLNIEATQKQSGTKSGLINYFNQAMGFIKKHNKLIEGLSMLTDKDISKIMDMLIDFRSVDKKKVVICFDDLERAIRKGNPDELMGMINDLTENQGFKVIVMANEDFMKQTDKKSLQFKEKVVEKSVLYKPDTRKIFVEMINNYDNTEFTKLMSSEDYLKTIDPSSEVYAHSDYLKTNKQNLRTLKFAISQYFCLYCEYTKDKTSLNYTEKNELYYMWMFLLGVSIEYKNNKLSYEDKRSLESYQEIISPDFKIDLGEEDSALFSKEEEVVEKEPKKYNEEENRKYAQWFFKTYIKVYEKKPIFLSTVYDFITSGSTLNSESFLKEMTVINSSVQTNQPQVILMEKFMNGVWKFKDEEFEIELNKLYNYVKSALFENYITYLNATFFICAFKQVLQDNEDTIKENIKKAIDSFTEKIELHPLIISSVQNVADQLSNEVRWLHSYILQKLDEKQKSIQNEDSKRFFDEFYTDIESFSKKFIHHPDQTPRYYKTPVLVGFDSIKIEQKVAQMELSEAESLTRMLKDRYISLNAPIELVAEMPFIKAIRDGLKKRNAPKRLLSNKIIEQQLQPMIDKVLRIYGNIPVS